MRPALAALPKNEFEQVRYPARSKLGGHEEERLPVRRRQPAPPPQQIATGRTSGHCEFSSQRRSQALDCNSPTNHELHRAYTLAAPEEEAASTTGREAVQHDQSPWRGQEHSANDPKEPNELRKDEPALTDRPRCLASGL